MADRALGMKWKTPDSEDQLKPRPGLSANTRTSLWETRWPAIALQECIDLVEAAPPEHRLQVKFELPCADCPMATSCLNAKHKELGSLMYSREILTSPRTSESSLFPLELFEPMLNRQAQCVPHWRKQFGVESEYVVVQAWDIAWSEKVGGDYLVCMTGYVHLRSGRRVLIDIERWQQVSFDDQIDLIVSKRNAYDVDIVVIESDAAQQVWHKSVKKRTPVPVLAHSAGGSKDDAAKTDLRHGVPGLLIKLENRMWEFPYKKGTYHHDEVENFLGECEAFGWVDGKLQGVGEHDDSVMTFWHLDWGMDRTTIDGVRQHSTGRVPGAR